MPAMVSTSSALSLGAHDAVNTTSSFKGSTVTDMAQEDANSKDRQISVQAPKHQTFLLLQQTLIIFSCYSIYGVLQEYLLKRIPGFEFGIFLTLYQFLVYTLLVFYKRNYLEPPTRLHAPVRSYALIAFLSITTMALSNKSVLYLNYPTQVLFKNGKLIPVMLVGRAYFGKKYSPLHYTAVITITIGLMIFSVGDSLANASFNSQGIVLISGALCADALIGNAQERILQLYRSTTSEMILYSKLIGCGYLFIASVCLGEFLPAISFCLRTPFALLLMTAFSIVGCVGEFAVMALVKNFGALEAVTVTSMRKMFTILLSVMIFPKPFTLTHGIGALMVFFALALNVYAKNPKLVQKALRTSHVGRLILRFTTNTFNFVQTEEVPLTEPEELV